MQVSLQRSSPDDAPKRHVVAPAQGKLRYDRTNLKLRIGHPATTLVRATKGATFAARSPLVAAGYIHVPGVALDKHNEKLCRDGGEQRPL